MNYIDTHFWKIAYPFFTALFSFAIGYMVASVF